MKHRPVVRVDGTHSWTVLRCVSVPQRPDLALVSGSGSRMSVWGCGSTVGRSPATAGCPGWCKQALGVCAALAAGVPEWRRGGVRHSLENLVRQREKWNRWCEDNSSAFEYTAVSNMRHCVGADDRNRTRNLLFTKCALPPR